MGVVGLIGILLFFAGVHVLWQARHEVLDWLREFFRILRVEFTRRSNPVAAPPSSAHPEAELPDGLSEQPRGRHHRGALRLVGGVGLMVLGQVLFLLDLAF